MSTPIIIAGYADMRSICELNQLQLNRRIVVFSMNCAELDTVISEPI